MKVSTYMFVGLWCKAVYSLVEQGSLQRPNRTFYKGQNKQMGKQKDTCLLGVLLPPGNACPSPSEV